MTDNETRPDSGQNNLARRPMDLVSRGKLLAHNIIVSNPAMSIHEAAMKGKPP